ncbi:Uncharacterized protein dnm_075090 [Desulfonema magnum]|uniref:Uncharacterized protein n=1 Tax=Desulfonema magnum TaxID=45655 RepID=A0A975BTW8_9BACT|nr:Uncharacterized protein dnm_075090 [Desulfonema magnum]
MPGRPSPVRAAYLQHSSCRPYGTWQGGCKPAATNMPPLQGLVGSSPKSVIIRNSKLET